MNNCSTIIALVEQLFICSFLKRAVIYMSEELREDIRKIGISAVLLAAVMLLDRFLNLPDMGSASALSYSISHGWL